MHLFAQIEKEIGVISKIEISEDRKLILQPLIGYIQRKLQQQATVQLNFICTHNSRRSHLAQVWAQTMSSYFDVPNVMCYSGGTEATALFPMVARTLEQMGFKIEIDSQVVNPRYLIQFSENNAPIVGFSKIYDDPYNPKTDFAAIMTCSQADNDCPLISGAEKRIAISYDDPKLFDGTPIQAEKYAERSREIAAEMYYVFSNVHVEFP